MVNLEQVLSQEDKEYVLNELVRERRKRALCEFYEKHGRTDVLWGLVYLDVDLFYRLVDERVEAPNPLFSPRNMATLSMLFQYNSELFQSVADKRRRCLDALLNNPREIRRIAFMFSGDYVADKPGRILSPDEALSYFKNHISDEKDKIEEICRELNYNKETCKSIDALFQDYEKGLDEILRTLRELDIPDPSEFIEFIYNRVGFDTNLVNDLLPYLARLTATQAPYKPNDATRFYEVYLNSPRICRGRSKEDILQELRSLIDREREIHYVALEEIVRLNEVSILDELLECATIESPYQVVCRLGKGKSGRTYKVYSPHLKKHRALKIIDNPNPKEAELMARLGGESLDNVVQIHEAGTHFVKVNGDEKYALVMEFVDGYTLDRLLGISIHGDIIEYGAQILNGIIRLREHGITHRDLHLGNIKVTPQKQVKILDFGIATDEEHPPPKDNRRYGTPASREADDVFSLGLIVYKLYTYKHLVLDRGEDMGNATYAEAIAEMKEEIYNKKGRLKRSYVRKIPKPIRGIVVACLEGQSIDAIKKEFLAAEPSVEYYFMNRTDLITRILDRDREMLRLRRGE